MNRRMVAAGVLVAVALALAWPSGAIAQEAASAARARRILDEAQAHYDAGRNALATEGYLQVYDVLIELGRRTAPIALWNAGNALADVPGRERDAVRILRRFLAESTTLTDIAEVRGWRSTSVGLIAELEARVGQDLGQPDGASGDSPAPPPERESGSISPIGPILLAVGGAALIPGLITIGLAYGQDQDLIARCPARMACDSGTRSEAEAARDLGLAGDALWIVGASIALVGLVLTFVLEEGGEGRSARSSLRFESTTGGGIASIAWRVP